MRYEDPNQWRRPVPGPEPVPQPPLWQIALAVALFVGAALFLEWLRFTYD